MNRVITSALLGLVLSGCDEPRAATKAKPAPSAFAPEPIPKASIETPAVTVPAALSWFVIGGGADPLSNQVSLAQDAELVQGLLAGTGLTLFASGPGAQLAVDDKKPLDPSTNVRLRLSTLFGPPSGLAIRYEPATIAIDGPATREHVLSALEAALAQGKDPLFVYATCHGERGNVARENAMSLWGGPGLTVSDFAELFEGQESTRPSRFVITSCYGGGFAEAIYRGADAERGLVESDMCGLFAAPWDDEASGCDPNPDRRDQESYAIHFWHALLGEDRQGKSRKAQIDLDGDGAINLLEAHTFARIHAASFDNPTSTSERFLREGEPVQGKVTLDPLAAPEEVSVIRALGERLELDDEASARGRLSEIDRALTEVSALLAEAQAAEEQAYQALRIGLVERWPLLEHPWEERTQRMLRREGREILRMLNDSELSLSHAHALKELDEVSMQQDLVRVERARVLRLVRAFETLRLASVLKQRGGEAFKRYERLRNCERWVPPLRQKLK